MWILPGIIITVVHVETALVEFVPVLVLLCVPRLRVPSLRLTLALEGHIRRLLWISTGAVLQRCTHVVVATLVSRVGVDILVLKCLVWHALFLLVVGARCLHVDVHPRCVTELVVKLQRHLILSLRPLVLIL